MNPQLDRVLQPTETLLAYSVTRRVAYWVVVFV